MELYIADLQIVLRKKQNDLYYGENNEEFF